MQPDQSKPPYLIPTMAEIARVPWNGLTVVSLFAGCGGSSTGYRMAGYRVLLANEFVPIAQESYAANMAPHTVLATEDVKQLTGAEILKRIGLRPGELDILDGSPPCQAFSTAGKREKGWGTERKYEHGASQRNEDLFDEYVRLLRELQPRAFVAENVQIQNINTAAVNPKMPLCLVELRNVYGATMVYPVGIVAQTFAAIAGDKTLTAATLRNIRKLGYRIVIESGGAGTGYDFLNRFIG